MNKKDFARHCIADSLFELLKTMEYNQIRIQDITDKSGFSRMAYYRNFNSFDDVLDYYLTSFNQEFIDATEIKMENEKLEDFFTAVYTHMSSNEGKAISKVLYKRGLIDRIGRQFDNFLMQKTTGENAYYYSFIAGGMFKAYQEWVKRDYKETPNQLAKILIKNLKESMFLQK